MLEVRNRSLDPLLSLWILRPNWSLHTESSRGPHASTLGTCAKGDPSQGQEHFHRHKVMAKDVQWSIIYNSKKSEWIQIPDGRKMTFLFLFLFFTMWEIQVTEYGDYRRVFHLYGEMLRIYVNTE